MKASKEIGIEGQKNAGLDFSYFKTNLTNLWSFSVSGTGGNWGGIGFCLRIWGGEFDLNEFDLTTLELPFISLWLSCLGSAKASGVNVEGSTIGEGRYGELEAKVEIKKV